MEWFVGPDLPEEVNGVKYSQAVPHYYSFLQVGGMNGPVGLTRSVFEFDGANNGWIVRDERMNVGLTEHVAFKIPDSVLGC